MREYFMTTERTGFSKWSEGDFDLASQLWGDEEVARYLCVSGRFTEEEIAERLQSEVESDMESGIQYWPFFELSTGELIGCCGLRPTDEAYNAFEMGFHLRKKYWRRGYGFEAGQAVLQYGFSHLGADKIFAGHHPQNLASKTLLIKMGFTYLYDNLYPPTGIYHPVYVMTPEKLACEERIARLFNEKTALLIIDMQNAFVEPAAALCIKGAKATVPACKRAIDAARQKGSPVFWIKREYRSDGSDVEFTRRKAWASAEGVLAPGSKGINSAEEASGLDRKPEDYVIIKPRWSAFFQTELDLILRRLGIETTVIIGTTTPNCVRATCYDAIALDYRAVLIDSCCSSQTAEIQKANMDDMERIGAEMIR